MQFFNCLHYSQLGQFLLLLCSIIGVTKFIFCKERIILVFMGHLVSITAIQIYHCRKNRQCANSVQDLCFNKTLFTKAERGAGVARRSYIDWTLSNSITIQ